MNDKTSDVEYTLDLRKNLDFSLVAKKKLMKARIFVTLKPSVLDPQGKAIQHSAELQGFDSISEVRQGKYFTVEIDEDLSEPDALAVAERIAQEILANPVIEDYEVELDS